MSDTPPATGAAQRWLTFYASRWFDRSIALVLAAGYCVWLLGTVRDLGYARDEGFYFDAADSYGRWFKALARDPLGALSQNVVDRYWRANHEHPALIKSLFALSRALFHDTLGWFREPGTSYRFVGMLLSAQAVAIVYLWGSRALALRDVVYSRLGAGVAACSFALMPRIFYHAHLDCFDMPVLSMWMLTGYAYWRGLLRPTWGWALVTGLLYGLLLNTKHNSWLMPFALVAHTLWQRGPELWQALRARQWRAALATIPRALWLMASVGPLLFYATWPWIWFDTLDRLEEYVVFHTRHVYYNIEFLGQTYFEPPFPRSYAPLMTLATVPAVTLLLFGIGLTLFAVREGRRWVAHFRKVPLSEPASDAAERQTALSQWRSTQALWLLFILVSYSPWLSTSSPIFGGTKHWTIAYPFMTLFGGAALVCLCRAAHSALGGTAWRERGLAAVLAALVLVAPLAITVHSHPWGLTTYTPLVGGAPGAATLGLNRSFWGYTTGAVQEQINELAPRNAKVFVHDTALSAWNMLERDGRLRSDLNPQLGVATTKLGVYHHEQHMSRVEHQIWVDYGTVRPVHIGAYDGVPVVWLYKRP